MNINLLQLNERLVCAVGLLEAVQRGCPSALRSSARRVVSRVLAALRSPLAAPRLLPAHRRLGAALLPARLPAPLRDHVTRTTLRCVRADAPTRVCNANSIENS